MFARTATRTGVQLPSPPVSLFSATYTSENAYIGTTVGTHPQESNDVHYGLRHGGSQLRSNIANDDRCKYAKFFSRPDIARGSARRPRGGRGWGVTPSPWWDGHPPFSREVV